WLDRVPRASHPLAAARTGRLEGESRRAGLLGHRQRHNQHAIAVCGCAELTVHGGGEGQLAVVAARVPLIQQYRAALLPALARLSAVARPERRVAVSDVRGLNFERAVSVSFAELTV